MERNMKAVFQMVVIYLRPVGSTEALKRQERSERNGASRHVESFLDIDHQRNVCAE